ncbi:MAG: hypothetical protein RL095_2823 [Verrucomicrobiota bacterium]|jgi:hypothetical protein
MKILSLLFAALLTGSCHKASSTRIPEPQAQKNVYEPAEGDVLFQKIGDAPLPQAIRIATLSEFSHCGLVLQGKEGDWKVIEAIGPVQETPFEEWIARDQGRFTACRLQSDRRASIAAWIASARKYLGRPYDIHYSLDDEHIYCSELVWKAWRDATGEELGRLQKLGELNWRPATPVILAIEGRLPLERQMITPVEISRAPELQRIWGGDGRLELPAPQPGAAQSPPITDGQALPKSH